jgi:outer membrane biosynthesis protein TonB
MSMSRREISSVSLSMAISVAIHMIILTVVWVILLQTPEPELDLRLEVVLNPPPASQSPVTETQSTAPEPDSAEQSPASEPAAESPSPAPSPQPESAAAPPSRTAPAQPTPAASPRPAVPENPAPAEPDYAVQEPAAEPRRATSLGSFLDTEDTSSESDAPEGFNPDQSRTENANTTAAPSPDSSTASEDPAADREVERQLALFSQRMASQYAESDPDPEAASAGPASSTAALGENFSSELRRSGRRLVSADRLDFSQYLEQAQTEWPASFTILLQVNESGFVKILNEAQISAYNAELMLAFYQVFSGQVFDAEIGAEPIEGSVTIRFR